MAIKAPKLILPDFVLPNALPGTAQWISDIPDGSLGNYEFRQIELTCILAATVTAHRVPPGGTPVAANRFITAMPFTVGQKIDVYWDPEQSIWPGGYSLFIFASLANAINCAVHANGVT